MPEVGDAAVIKAARASAQRLDNGNYHALIDRMAQASLVFIGEASHGTHEFYQERAEITKRLIKEHGFRGVAIDAAWPGACRVHRYVTNRGESRDVRDSLSGFRYFPNWIWRNRVVEEFVGWLRTHNDSLPPSQSRVGFYGFDLYGLHPSIRLILEYLDKVDSRAAARARHRYSRFDHFGEDAEPSGYATDFGLDKSSEKDLISQLTELQKRELDLVQSEGQAAQDEYIQVVQNARLVKNAENYYREMFHGRISAWNIRETHMAQTLDALRNQLGTKNTSPKLVVWAHNLHIGDASATEFGQRGALSIGQVMRDKYEDDCFLLGFTTCSGTVTAASDWGARAEKKALRPALTGSYEELFHRTGLSDFLISLWDYEAATGELKQSRLERAVGVIYRPETERPSHYFYARLSDQFDAVIHLDHTRAVDPLEFTPQPWDAETVGTFPSTF